MSKFVYLIILYVATACLDSANESRSVRVSREALHLKMRKGTLVDPVRLLTMVGYNTIMPDKLLMYRPNLRRNNRKD